MLLVSISAQQAANSEFGIGIAYTGWCRRRSRLASRGLLHCCQQVAEDLVVVDLVITDARQQLAELAIRYLPDLPGVVGRDGAFSVNVSLKHLCRTASQGQRAPLNDGVPITFGDLLGKPEFTVTADMRYAGQAFDLQVAVPDDLRRKPNAEGLSELFHQEHEKIYGFRDLESGVEITPDLITRGAIAGVRVASETLNEGITTVRDPGCRHWAWLRPVLNSKIPAGQ